MNQLGKLWRSLSRAQQVSLALVPLVVCALAWGGFKWVHESDFHVVYSGLAPEDAAAVTQKLREAGIEYRLDETGASILAPSGRIAEARLAIAGAGLPHSGRIGFELFDRTNLGASDFAEQVNYRRALEGELERTIATLAEVEQARVHLTFAKESVFLDERRPSKATVVLRLKRSTPLAAANVTAVANLVASAVDGLAPESVAIIDSNGRLLNRPQAEGDSGAQVAEANLQYKQQIEAEMMSKVNAALEPLLGAGKFKAGVNVDCDFASTEENEEAFDPNKSVMVTSQASEESSATGLSGGTPGSASNLPKPTAMPVRPAVGASGVTRKSENVTWQPSRTVRHTVQPRGMIRRISAAVLVDQNVRWEGSGAKMKKVIVPPSAEVLKGVRDVVAGVTGFNEQRGDAITVESLPFENTVSAEPPSPASSPSGREQNGVFHKQPLVIFGGIIAVVVLGFGFIIMFKLKRKPAAVEIQGAPKLGARPEEPKIDAPARTPNQEAQDYQAQLESEALSHLKLSASSGKTEDLVRRIRESAHKDAQGMANALRAWISEEQNRRTT